MTIPVTILTGTLGAGKTTLLNRILSGDHGRKFGVVVNEFGEIGIDGDLVVGPREDIVELSNGCLCCTTRDDLAAILHDLVARPVALDGILIETTGLAAPAAVAQLFFYDPGLRAAARLDAVVTVVDALHAPTQLVASAEAREQVAFADMLILNKTDLVAADALATVEARMRAINPSAQMQHARNADIPVGALFDRGSFDLDRILAMVPDFLTNEAEHAHDEDIISISLTLDRPVDATVFSLWIRAIMLEAGADMLRIKGILALKNIDRRYAFQAVGMVADAGFVGPWAAGDARQSRMVFIGRGLNRPRLRRGFEGCVAGLPVPAA